MTRILSVFNLLKRVGFAVLFFGANAFAQPQVPIEWGPLRVLRNSPELFGVQKSFGQGDTIILQGIHHVPGASTSTVTVSPDNGLTWCPWHVLADTTQELRGIYIDFAITSQGIHAIHDLPPLSIGLYTTTDLGWTWSVTPTPDTIYFSGPLATRGDTIFCRMHSGVHWDGVSWTTDIGQTWSPVRYAGFGEEFPIHEIVLSASYVHAIASFRTFPDPQRLYHARAPLYEGGFELVQTIDPEILWHEGSKAESDDSGIVIVTSSVDFNYPVSPAQTAVKNQSMDDGATWSAADTLNPVETGGTTRIDHDGNLWIVIIGDSTRLDGFERDGAKYVFSANRGRSWYPRHQVYGDNIIYGLAGNVDVDAARNRIRFYFACEQMDSVWGKYYLQWEGQIRRDSLNPVIESATMLPEVVRVDTIAEFACTAGDNDSLWLMQVVLRRAWTEDSLILTLDRDAGNNFAGAWEVPDDTARWLYYYRAEDMWENVTFFPTEGPANSWVVYSGTIVFADHAGPVPETARLLAFPNPSNGSVTIQGFWDIPAQSGEFVIYNILGKEVRRFDYSEGARRFSINWNWEDNQHHPLATGIYFLTAPSTGLRPVKLLLLR